MAMPSPILANAATTFIEEALTRGHSTKDIINAFNMRICSKLVERKDEAGVAALMTAADTNRIWLESQGFKIGRRLS